MKVTKYIVQKMWGKELMGNPYEVDTIEELLEELRDEEESVMDEHNEGSIFEYKVTMMNNVEEKAL